jgi:hypothetical protein
VIHGLAVSNVFLKSVELLTTVVGLEWLTDSWTPFPHDHLVALPHFKYRPALDPDECPCEVVPATSLSSAP